MKKPTTYEEAIKRQKEINDVCRSFENASRYGRPSESVINTPATFKSDLFDLCMSHLDSGTTSMEEIIGIMEITKMSLHSYFIVDPEVLLRDYLVEEDTAE